MKLTKEEIQNFGENKELEDLADKLIKMKGEWINKMRKLLLNIANKIYSKYAFQEVREGQLFIFKNDMFRVVKTTLEQEPACLDKLTVEIHKVGTLTEYISDKLSKKK